MLQVKLKVVYNINVDNEIIVAWNKRYERSGDKSAPFPLPDELQLYDEDGDQIDSASFTAASIGDSLKFNGDFFRVIEARHGHHGAYGIS